jgi:hypothetical protein
MLDLAVGAALVLVAFGLLPAILLPARRYQSALFAGSLVVSWTLLFLWACWILAGALSMVLDRLAHA